ncbi:MAG: hypothetical protein WBA07_13950 [Rivularia sp. (in: cyanobacteria)]
MMSIFIFLLKNKGKKNLPAKEDLPLSSRLMKDSVLVPVTVNSS